MKIELLVRPYGQMIGLARYTESLCQALTRANIDYSLITPTYSLAVYTAHSILKLAGFDLLSFFTTYPLSANLGSMSIKHLTIQQMALLLWIKPKLRPIVVTVHDIVPYLTRKDHRQNSFRHPVERIFDQMAMMALRRADLILSVSHYTKQTLVDALGCQADRIAVIHEGVEHEKFRPMPIPHSFRSRYALDECYRYILYVGSENPRKNLPRLLEAFARLHTTMPDVKLLKVGWKQYAAHADQFQQRLHELGLEDAVLCFDHVADNDLALFYNLADLFVFPSLYEGFGLPPLEAMASGTPVVCSNATSLPEVVGDAAILFDPCDVSALTESMQRVLSDADLWNDLRAKGLERASMFTWDRTANETIDIYKRLHSFRSSSYANLD